MPGHHHDLEAAGRDAGRAPPGRGGAAAAGASKQLGVQAGGGSKRLGVPSRAVFRQPLL